MSNHPIFSKSKILLSQAAARKFLNLQRKQGISSGGLKFADVKGLCGEGYDYLINFALAPEKDDAVFYSHGIAIYVPQLSLPRLQGSILNCAKKKIEHHREAADSTLREHFSIRNPNIKGPCPCACGNGFGC